MRIDENIVLLNLLTASAAITFGIDSLVCSIININLTVLVPLVELYNCGTMYVFLECFCVTVGRAAASETG